jgi:F-type H+-transporting ATPase subunit b
MRLLFVTLIAFLAIEKHLLSAEAGMPQLDPKYWASQAFWLIIVFTILYLLMSKIYIPKIKNNLEDRENKIKNDLEDAKKFKELSEKKQKEYEEVIDKAKKDVVKTLQESKKNLDKDVMSKKLLIEKEIEKEIEKAEKEILELKKNSINSINQISVELTSKIIEDISGDRLNESSIRAAVAEVAKNKIGNNL